MHHHRYNLKAATVGRFSFLSMCNERNLIRYTLVSSLIKAVAIWMSLLYLQRGNLIKGKKPISALLNSCKPMLWRC